MNVMSALNVRVPVITPEVTVIVDPGQSAKKFGVTSHPQLDSTFHTPTMSPPQAATSTSHVVSIIAPSSDDTSPIVPTTSSPRHTPGSIGPVVESSPLLSPVVTSPVDSDVSLVVELVVPLDVVGLDVLGLVALAPVDASVPSLSVPSPDASSDGHPVSTNNAVATTTRLNETNVITNRFTGAVAAAQVLSTTVAYCPQMRKPRCTIVPLLNTKNEVSYFSSVA